MPNTMKTAALDYLNRHLTNAMNALGHAMKRRNNEEEIRNLQKKISVLYWMQNVVSREEDHED